MRPNKPFQWTPKLNTLFENTKASIIEAIKEGVAIFDVGRTTCLRTDWSDKGIGFLPRAETL